MDKQPVNGAFTVNRIIPVVQVSQDKLQEAVRALRQQNAVIDAHVDQRGRLRATYDASRLNMRDIELMLDCLKIPRDTSLWSRMKLAWFRLTDDNARDNAQAGNGACCNRPPVVPRNLSSVKKRPRGLCKTANPTWWRMRDVYVVDTAMSFSSVSVITNSLRLQLVRLRGGEKNGHGQVDGSGKEMAHEEKSSYCSKVIFCVAHTGQHRAGATGARAHAARFYLER